MIKYNLICVDCSETFDSWFASSKEYERLKKKNFINCHYCGEKNVKKNLMAPSLKNKSNRAEILKNKKFKNTIKEYQKFIKDNFKYVGENFAYEARSIHYDEKKNSKAIYGRASYKEIKELNEEGIEISTIPWIEDKNN